MDDHRPWRYFDVAMLCLYGVLVLVHLIMLLIDGMRDDLLLMCTFTGLLFVSYLVFMRWRSRRECRMRAREDRWWAALIAEYRRQKQQTIDAQVMLDPSGPESLEDWCAQVDRLLHDAGQPLEPQP